MDREATLARLDRWWRLKSDPRLRVLLRRGWTQPMARRLQHSAARLVEGKPVVGVGKRGRTHRDLAGFFRGTRFHAADVIKVETSHEISVRDLARRVLTFSSSSLDVLGDKIESMLA